MGLFSGKSSSGKDSGGQGQTWRLGSGGPVVDASGHQTKQSKREQQQAASRKNAKSN